LIIILLGGGAPNPGISTAHGPELFLIQPIGRLISILRPLFIEQTSIEKACQKPLLQNPLPILLGEYRLWKRDDPKTKGVLKEEGEIYCAILKSYSPCPIRVSPPAWLEEPIY